MNDIQGSHFRQPSTDNMSEAQDIHFRKTSTEPNMQTPQCKLPNTQQRHERPQKLRDLHPKDPTTVPHRYPKRSNRTVKSGQTLTYSDDTPVPDDDDNTAIDNNNISIPPTDPTTPTADLQQQFLRSHDTHITDQPDSFVYLRDNGENENTDPIWKEFEVTLRQWKSEIGT
jgi:hypothetical protein